ncbi:hypothetical protein DL96DRAFT_1520014 [Flagelloscypha sp. PMI_526]|nr:hypothetical protein DL96DRAFT_1520014 [Flagelloscypha sp. PMI_526]
MLFDPSTTQHLKPWLIRTLEPICDAEPNALADYILALLKHNVSEPEMRKELADQLDEFLEKECQPFVEMLFKVLRSRSYVPYSDGSSSSNSAHSGPVPMDTSSGSSADHSRKRGREEDDYDQHGPAKGPRVSSEGQFSRYSNGHGPSTGHWNSHPQPPLPREYPVLPPNGRPYQPSALPRGMCRDYHNHGFCMRGQQCKYSHGQDVIVSDFMFPMGPPRMPFIPMFDHPGPYPMDSPGYDPQYSRMPMGRFPPTGPRASNQAPNVMPRIPMEDGSRAMLGHYSSSGSSVIQDLTPTTADRPDRPHPRPYANSPPSGPAADRMNGTSRMNSQPIPGGPVPSGQMDVDHAPMSSSPPPHRGGFRGGRGSGRPRDAPGTFSADASSLRPEKRKGQTLVVEKIPREKLDIEHVSEWFKRFGTVTNAAIDASQAKALVSFATTDEAHAAWKCEDAVFGNRFVKVFWHRPMEGHGQKGAKMLAASAQAVADLTSGKPGTTTTTPMKPANRTLNNTAQNGLAAKQQLLEKQIAEQKMLMQSLETASPEEKKDVMSRLRKLGEEMKAPLPTGPASSHEREQKLKERLDKELEMTSPQSEVDTGEDTEALKQQLESLKAEAASLGLPPTTGDLAHPTRGYRGRGRGRGRGGFYRGGFQRGGYVGGNFKLDNRPKKLLIKGVAPESTDLQPLRDWYETTGGLDSLDRLDDGTIVASFKSRDSAEQGLAKGANIPQVGSVQLSWHKGDAPSMKSSSPVPQQVSEDSEMASDSADHHGHGGEEGRVIEHEDEDRSGGWGDDDGSGMI